MGDRDLAGLAPLVGRQLDRRALRGLGDQGRQPGAQVGEDRLQVGRAGARLELVEQGVVGLVADADGLRLAALEGDDGLQRAGVGGEVVGGAGRRPRGHAARAGLAQLAHQVLGHAQGALVVPRGQAHHGAGLVVQALGARERGQRLARVRSHELAVMERGERARLARAPLGAGGGISVSRSQPSRLPMPPRSERVPTHSTTRSHSGDVGPCTPGILDTPGRAGGGRILAR